MNAYIYNAALYCGEHGAAINDRIRAATGEPTDAMLDNSDEWVIPTPDGGGEADTPQHCRNCGEFLENPLTDDGLRWVRLQLRILAADSCCEPNDGCNQCVGEAPIHLDQYAEFYGIEAPAMK